VFGPHTLLGLWRALEDMNNVPNGWLTAIATDWERGTSDSQSVSYSVENRGRALSPLTMTAAIWVGFHPTIPAADIGWPDGGVPVNWDQAPANDGAANGMVSCWDEGQDPTTGQPVSVTVQGGGAGAADAGGGTAAAGNVAVDVSASTWGPWKVAGAITGAVAAVGGLALALWKAGKKGRGGHRRG